MKRARVLIVCCLAAGVLPFAPGTSRGSGSGSRTSETLERKDARRLDPGRPTAEDWAVLQAALAGVSVKGRLPPIVAAETLTSGYVRAHLPDLQFRMERPPARIEELLGQWEERNRTSVVLLAEKLPAGSRVFPWKQIDEVLDRPGGWDAFYEEYPRTLGFIRLSLPAYSRDRKTAILFYENVTHSFSGDKPFCVYQKRGGKWRFGWRLGGLFV